MRKVSKLHKKGPDRILLFTILALACVGLLMLYSASTVLSYKNVGNTTYYFFHQLFYGFIPGMVLLYLFSRLDYHYWLKLVPYVAIFSLILLVAVKIPGLGFSSGGATRWIHLGFVTFQPSELAKFAVLLYTAAWVEKKRAHFKNFYLGLLPYLIVMGLFALLILWQPDVGTMMVLIFTGLVMLFVSGLELKYFSGIGALGTLLFLLIVKLEPYRTARLLTFLDPEKDLQGAAYQINQGLLAIGAGGIFGYGYGLSRQKHNYLPEAFGDSIFAVMAEELGFMKTSIVILLFLTLILRGIIVSLKAPDVFGRVLGIGIVTFIAVQTIINIGANLALLPLTGITLPLVSYGSSSLIITLASLGVLLNISRQARVKA